MAGVPSSGKNTPHEGLLPEKQWTSRPISRRMMVSQGVQGAVDRESHELLLRGHNELRRLSHGLLLADVDIGQDGLAVVVQGEREHVRHVVTVEVLVVERSDPVVIEQGDRDLCRPDSLVQQGGADGPREKIPIDERRMCGPGSTRRRGVDVDGQRLGI